MPEPPQVLACRPIDRTIAAKALHTSPESVFTSAGKALKNSDLFFHGVGLQIARVDLTQ
jgi:hypothetical protein